MITKILCVLILLSSMSYAKEKDDAKFLVVDADTYKKIELLNILNGGIKKEYRVSSKSVSDKDLKKYYPEFFLFNGPICNSVKKIVSNKSQLNKKNTTLISEKDIKKEIKRIKLLQMLNETNESIVTSKINKNIIKSLALICNNQLFLRGKFYRTNDNIGDFIIKSINPDNSSIYLEVR